MAQQQYTLFKKFIGYGHYKLIIAGKEGTCMESVTGDMDLKADYLLSWRKKEKKPLRKR
ncbi:hypothetical protein [Phocaeicola plebeius]|uniref:hypothetical protein n=1 Tax=Phocaeicola plebeius TaxID=310297 RepID=UPI003AEF4F7F